MATRFYIPSDVAAPVSPTFEAGWTTTSGAVRRLLTAAKGTSAIATEATTSVDAASAIILGIQGVSYPLKGGTITAGCTVTAQFMAREFSANDNIDRMQFYAAIVSNDGTSVVGTLYARSIYVPTLELDPTQFKNKKWMDGGDAASAVTYPDGSRLVVEIGARSVSGTTPIELAFKTGENATDLPIDDTTTTDGACWVEFSETIELLQPGAGSVATPVGSASGNSTITGTATGSSATPVGQGSGGVSSLSAAARLAYPGNPMGKLGYGLRIPPTWIPT